VNGMRVLIRYGEIGIKSRKVRSRFERQLIENIKLMLLREGVEGVVSRTENRIFLITDDAKEYASDRILKHTFGIVSFSKVISVSSSGLDDISEVAVKVASKWHHGRFAVRCRRTGSHNYTSMTAAAHIGERILQANPLLKVDLTDPDHEIFIEIRHGVSFIYTDMVPGPGGLPVGTAGKIASVIHDEMDALAVWLMMKRGCMPLLSGDKRVVEEYILPWLPKLRFYEDIPIERLISYADHILVSREQDPVRMEKPEGYTIFYPLAGLSEEDLERLLRGMHQ